jgi:hypothetical protein
LKLAIRNEVAGSVEDHMSHSLSMRRPKVNELPLETMWLVLSITLGDIRNVHFLEASMAHSVEPVGHRHPVSDQHEGVLAFASLLREDTVKVQFLHRLQ